MLQKRKSHAFGKDVYLLGTNEYGEPIWLESASWDCGWYWGFGYIEVYTNKNHPEKARDISSHSHFDGLVGFKDEHNNYIHHLNESPRMESTVLTDKESWELCDLMKQFYTLREAAEIFHTGNAHLTSCGISNKNPEMEREINEEILPRIFERIYEILTPPNAEDSYDAVGL